MEMMVILEVEVVVMDMVKVNMVVMRKEIEEVMVKIEDL